MTLLKVGHKALTDVDGLTLAARQTHAGQAHFAGGGPPGATCKQCVNWIVQGNDERAYYKSRVCKKGTGKPVPGSAIACKHFETAPA